MRYNRKVKCSGRRVVENDGGTGRTGVQSVCIVLGGTIILGVMSEIHTAIVAVGAHRYVVNHRRIRRERCKTAHREGGKSSLDESDGSWDEHGSSAKSRAICMRLYTFPSYIGLLNESRVIGGHAIKLSVGHTN
jgi:hypothetical protein